MMLPSKRDPQCSSSRHTASALVIPTQLVLTRYAASKVLEAAELKAKDEDWARDDLCVRRRRRAAALGTPRRRVPRSVTLATEKARTAAQFRKLHLDFESAANDKRPALIEGPALRFWGWCRYLWMAAASAPSA